MSMDLLFFLIPVVLFLILKAFFSGSEIAMVSCDKLKLRHRAKEGDRGAKLVLDLFKTPDVILGTTLVGTNIATVTISTMAALFCIEFFGPSGDLLSVIIVTPFLLILGEIVPKSVFQQNANVIAPYIIYGLRFFSYLFFPVIFIFGRIARMATRMVGGNTSQQNMFITREEIRMLLEMSESAASVDNFDKRRIRRVIRFADTTVGEAMIPLAEVVGIKETAGIDTATKRVWELGFNRLPVFQGNITNILGVLTLSTWDLLDTEISKKKIEDFIETPLYISPKQTIDRALPLIQARPDHLAVVVDEFGSAVGILTMEDIFEEVVGEIDVGTDFDEYHRPKRRFAIERAEEDDVYMVDGRIPISLINEKLHMHLSVVEAHTVAGLISNRLRTIPKKGAYIEEEGFRFIVDEADERAVRRVRIERSM